MRVMGSIFVFKANTGISEFGMWHCLEHESFSKCRRARVFVVGYCMRVVTCTHSNGFLESSEPAANMPEEISLNNTWFRCVHVQSPLSR